MFIVITCGRDAAVITRVADPDHEPGLAGSEVCADSGMREDSVAKNVGHAVIAVAGCVQDFITEMCRPGSGGKFQPGRGVGDVELFDRLDDAMVVIGVFSFTGTNAKVGDQSMRLLRCSSRRLTMPRLTWLLERVKLVNSFLSVRARS